MCQKKSPVWYNVCIDVSNMELIELVMKCKISNLQFVEAEVSVWLSFSKCIFMK